jgi:hypothetical protein
MRNQERRAECGKLRAEFGELRAEFGEWRVELKALVCLPCKGGGPQSGGEVLIKSVESGVEGTRLPPLQGDGDRRAVEGF